MINQAFKQQMSQDPLLKNLVDQIYHQLILKGKNAKQAKTEVMTVVENNLAILQDYLQNQSHCNPETPECEQANPGFETILKYENGRFYSGVQHCLHWENEHRFEKLKKQFLYCDYDLDLFPQTVTDYWKTLEQEEAIFGHQEIQVRQIFLKKALEKLQIGIQGKGLYLYGLTGVGKSTLLKVLANTVAQNQNQTVSFVNLAKFVAKTKESLNDKKIREQKDNLQRLKEAAVLFIDDFGAESISPWSRDELLLNLLNERLEKRRLTFFASNFSMKQLEDNYFLAKERYAIDQVKRRRFLERVRALSEEYHLPGKSHRF